MGFSNAAGPFPGTVVSSSLCYGAPLVEESISAAATAMFIAE